MTKDLSYFFKENNNADAESQEVFISDRFKNEEGKVIPFLVKPISTERIEEIETECTKPILRKKRKVGEELDKQRYVARLMVEATVYPNFKDSALLSSYGVVDPTELVKKILHVPGEYAKLAEVVTAINGFDEDEDDVQATKN